MTPNRAADNTTVQPTNPIRIWLSWLLVGVPLTYGIVNIVIATTPLFTGG